MDFITAKGHKLRVHSIGKAHLENGKTIKLSGTFQDITDRKRAEEELQVSHDQLRALAARLQTVREEERTRVARDIHDVLAQELTRLKIDLVWLQGRLLKSGKAAAPEALAVRVGEMTRMADAAIHCVQRIATGLRPAVLDSLGLSAAVEWQSRDFQDHSGIQCNANVSAEELPVESDVATAVFRILQESLTNVQRHANATRVDIVLREESGQLLLRVQDNGCGIPATALGNPMSIGLTGMKERALLLGGHFEIWSRPESGTAVEVRLPLENNGSVDCVKNKEFQSGNAGIFPAY
ncbi:MAG: sensor histidine kinase [Victivallales bacterium]